jgi:hypothetical protein
MIAWEGHIMHTIRNFGGDMVNQRQYEHNISTVNQHRMEDYAVRVHADASRQPIGRCTPYYGPLIRMWDRITDWWEQHRAA